MNRHGATTTMIGVDEARARVLASAAPLPAGSVPVLEAQGQVLAEDIVAAADIPPFRNSAMDGYAVRAIDLAGVGPDAPARLRVVGQGPAGYAPSGTVVPGTAIRIMTGAPLPHGADTVVRFEDTDEARRDRGALAETPTDSVAIFTAQGPWINVREAGEDVRHGATVLRAGTILRAPEIGVLAALGKGTVAVHRRPVVAILSTGDEVADPDQPLRPGQIRDSNSYTLAALARRYGGVPRLLGIARDSVADLTASLNAARDADLIVTSGGVSVGDYDMVKDVLQAEGEIAIWQVRMKPGRPLAFGQLHGRPFLGLPGNPVAAYVSFELFARPVILRQLGWADWRKPTVRARVLEAVDNGSGRRHYVRAWVAAGPHGPVVRPTGDQGAGVLTALTRANGLLIVPDGVTALAPGDWADVEMLHWEQGSGTLPLAEG